MSVTGGVFGENAAGIVKVFDGTVELSPFLNGTVAGGRAVLALVSTFEATRVAVLLLG